MRFSEADSSSGQLIDAYGKEGIRIGGRRFTRGLIVTPNRVEEGWGPADPADLTVEHLDALIAIEPGIQVIVLGTGETQVFPDPALYFAVIGRGVGFEVMDTGAACRTYNILMSEGRRVVAGLLPWS
ncbi:Mth938-like domain-containing protein [Thiocapsa sp.]|uniref:Mth938-like domain-containing protein n=1 Tax=Thiocapsa sp. TaxID=2024551 RepID=UPI0025F77467|nr:Mth938-like domain-containing protein [Thiocapsa sp.]